jgi:cytoskeleton protein RodZ
MNEKSEESIDTSSNEESVDTNSNVTKTYGSQLRTARIALKKSIQEIAIELNLHITVIDAIEEMDEAKLPVSAFVIGYIRSYAKIVDLDSDVLIKNYAAAESELRREVTENDLHTSLKAEKNYELNIKVSLAIVLAIAILLVILSWPNIQAILNASNLSMVEQENNVALEIEPTTYEVAEETVDDVTMTTEETVEEIDDVITTTVDVTENIAEVEEITPALEVATSERLVITASDDSWVEIKDNDNKQLFSNILKSGESRVFKSNNGYKLLIGRSASVTIVYLGKPVDFSRFIKRNGVSRFKLSEDGLSKYKYVE